MSVVKKRTVSHAALGVPRTISPNRHQARDWYYDKLPPESIDNYEVLRKAFLGNFSQEKKYIKDPVEIHHIKRNDECDDNFPKAEGGGGQSVKEKSPANADMLRIKLREAGSNKEIFTSMAWIKAFNINEPIYLELCHEFYSTYEFDEVCVDDELQTKKIIKFRLGDRAHSLTLLEFARRLGLYHVDELDEEGFDVYFQGGMRSDDHFNAQEHQNGYANVAWLIVRWMKRKEAGTQKESQICYVQFITKLARKARVLSDEDLYERMGNMKIHQGAIERMSYRQSYHWDRYAGVFEHMVGVYNVPLKGAYNPPGYAQPQYDQYYQQYPPQPPQQQGDDE
ncbi:hypothetical protein Tco_0850120 [Tanacetum coccineum]